MVPVRRVVRQSVERPRAAERPQAETPRPDEDATYQSGLAGTPWQRRRPTLQRMFESISSDYDRLNHLLSFGLDRRWRAWAVRSLREHANGAVLDLASGTGDMARPLARGRGGPVLRSDLSASLLRLGTAKLKREGGARSSPALACEMERLPLRSGSVDGIVQGFALRHCGSFDVLFTEARRVLRPGGRIALLDMRYPERGFWARPYRFYFRSLLPRLAGIFGGEVEAYRMMVDSVRRLPPEEELVAALRRAGFAEVESSPGIMGAVRLLTAVRP